MRYTTRPRMARKQKKTKKVVYLFASPDHGRWCGGGCRMLARRWGKRGVHWRERAWWTGGGLLWFILLSIQKLLSFCCCARVNACRFAPLRVLHAAKSSFIAPSSLCLFPSTRRSSRTASSSVSECLFIFIFLSLSLFCPLVWRCQDANSRTGCRPGNGSAVLHCYLFYRNFYYHFCGC